jgi:hypothetical protein
MRKSARDRSKDRLDAGDRGRSSGRTSKIAKKESRRKDRSESSKGEDSSPDVVLPSFDLKEGDHFLCPVYNKEEFVGTAAFRCEEQIAKNDTGVYVTVTLVAAEDNDLEKVLKAFLREDNGLLHVCERNPCSECQKSSLHVQYAQVCSRRDAERAAKLDFKEFGQRYWRKVATTHYKDRAVEKQLDAALSQASDSRSKKVTGGRSLSEKAQGPSGALEDRLKKLRSTAGEAVAGRTEPKRRRLDREDADGAVRNDDHSAGLRFRLEAIRDRTTRSGAATQVDQPSGGGMTDNDETVPSFLVRAASTWLKASKEVGARIMSPTELDSYEQQRSGRSRHRRRDHRGRRRRRDTSSDSRSSGSGFGVARGRGGPSSSQGYRLAGERFQEGLCQMGKYGLLKNTGSIEGSVIAPVATPFWMTIAKPSLKTELPFSVEREIMTLVKSLDLLSAGRLGELSDVLMARYQAVETSLGLGWKVAQHLEQLPRAMISSVPAAVQDSIVREEARELRTRELQLRVGQGVG